MTIKDNIFQWSDVINITRNTYDTYLKLDKIERDKYIKTEVKATYPDEHIDDVESFTNDYFSKHVEKEISAQLQISIGQMLLKHMKYHCGKPLKITMNNAIPDKHLPIIEYFERSRDYLQDYDYMIIEQKQYATLLDENFLLFQSHDFETYSGIGAINQPLTKVGKLRNLDIFTTWDYPDSNIQADGFDCIIGKKDWVDMDTIELFSGEVSNGYSKKILLKTSFPIKRGFMRIKGVIKNS